MQETAYARRGDRRKEQMSSRSGSGETGTVGGVDLSHSIDEDVREPDSGVGLF